MRETNLFGTFLDTVHAHSRREESFVDVFGKEQTIPTPNPKALAVYNALKACIAADAALSRAAADLPDYMPTQRPIDRYGPQVVEFHNALNELARAMGMER